MNKKWKLISDESQHQSD